MFVFFRPFFFHLHSIPRLLVGQNVKHNGYFVRAFFSDDEDTDADKALQVSPPDPDEDTVVTPMLSKDYRRVARMLGISSPEEDLHRKLSTSGKDLIMSFTEFCSLGLRTNLEVLSPSSPAVAKARAAINEGLSQVIVSNRAKSYFRLACLDLDATGNRRSASGKSRSGGKAVATPDCGGLLSSLCIIQFGLSRWPLMLDLVLEAMLVWLRKNGSFAPKCAEGPTLSDLAAPMPWDDYVSAIEKGVGEPKVRFGDFFLLLAFANVYFINVAVVTDFVVDGPLHQQPLSPGRAGATDMEWSRSCFAVIPEREASPRTAVLGMSCGGRLFQPLLPQKYFDALSTAAE